MKNKIRILLAVILPILAVSGMVFAYEAYDGTQVIEGEVFRNSIRPLLDSTYNLGENAYRWAAGYFDDLHAETITIDGVSAGDINLNNNLILNIGNASTDFTSEGGLNLAGALSVTGTSTLATTTITDLTVSGAASFGSITSGEADPIWTATSSNYYAIASDSYVLNTGDIMTGRLTINYGNSSSLVITPSATGTQDVIHITPSGALDADSHWDGIQITGTALDPAAGTLSVIDGIEVDFRGIVSGDNNANIKGFLVKHPATETSVGFQSTMMELTGNEDLTAFLAFAATPTLSFTADYRGLYVDWSGVQRDANAPILQGVRVELPATTTDFGASYAGLFSGNKDIIYLADGTYAINATGDVLLTGALEITGTSATAISVIGTHTTGGLMLTGTFANGQALTIGEGSVPVAFSGNELVEIRGQLVSTSSERGLMLVDVLSAPTSEDEDAGVTAIIAHAYGQYDYDDLNIGQLCGIEATVGLHADSVILGQRSGRTIPNMRGAWIGLGDGSKNLTLDGDAALLVLGKNFSNAGTTLNGRVDWIHLNNTGLIGNGPADAIIYGIDGPGGGLADYFLEIPASAPFAASGAATSSAWYDDVDGYLKIKVGSDIMYIPLFHD